MLSSIFKKENYLFPTGDGGQQIIVSTNVHFVFSYHMYKVHDCMKDQLHADTQTLHVKDIVCTFFLSFWFFFQKLNPSIEAPVTRILDQIRNCLESQERGTNISVGFKREEGGDTRKMILKINSQLAGLPFCWQFIGINAERELVNVFLVTLNSEVIAIFM